MTDMTTTAGGLPDRPGTARHVALMLAEAHRWARAVMRSYERRGPAALADLPGIEPVR